VAERDEIAVWSYAQTTPSLHGRFCNFNALGARVCDLTLLNEADGASTHGPLLLAGSDDGVIRVWRDWCSGPSVAPRLVTAFAAVDELLPAGPLGAARGMVSLWSQRRGQLLACSRASAAPVVQVWDMSTERCVQRLMSGLEGADHHITALCETGAGMHPAVVAAGASDGSIRLYDLRSGCYCFMAVTAEHKAAIVGLKSHREAEVRHFPPAALISADASGEMKYWDARAWSTASAVDSHRSPISTLALHERAPVVAAGSRNQLIKVLDMNAEVTNLIRYHDGFLGTRIGPVSCLAFHPHELLLAAGATDSVVSIYTCGSKRAPRDRHY